MKLISTPYKHYVDSHNEWLDKLPSEWVEKRVKDLFRLVTDMAVNNNDFELLSLYAAIGVRPRKDLEARGNKASSTDGYWLVRKGDIVVNKLLAWMGSVGLSEFDGVTSPAYDILRKTNKEVDPRYFSYLFRIERAKEIFKRNSRGIMDMRLRLYFDKLGALVVPVPSFATQKSIADYLDNKTAQIDQQIDLLSQKAKHYGELKQALINETVTRGLDKTVPMKDSGIGWIGYIPEHWDLKRIKDTTYVKGRIGWQGLRNEDFLDSGSYYCVTGTDLKQGEIDWSNCYYVDQERYKQDINIQLKIDDILITKDGTIGKVAIVKDIPLPATLNSGVFVTRSLKNSYVTKFMYWVLHSCQFTAFIDLTKGGSTIQHLYQNVFNRFIFSYPLLLEQKAIADYLDQKTAQIDAIVTTINAQIDHLKALRKTLINDVVTGKICVL